MPRMRDGRRLGGRYGAADHAEQYRPYRGASRLPKHPRKHGKPIGELHGGCIFPSWGGKSLAARSALLEQGRQGIGVGAAVRRWRLAEIEAHGD